MKIIYNALLLIAFYLILAMNTTTACTLIKITIDGKTIIGNNEDFSNPDTRIWFEPGNKKYFGTAYVGYNDLFPEGGINEAGLVFDAFGVSDKPVKDTAGKVPIFELDLKRKIMRECKTVGEVKALLSKYNLYFWSHSIWLFIDRSGKYLAFEGDKIYMGNNAYYVQTNFRQSEISNIKQINCWRYKKAMSLLKSHSEASVNYCTSLMDSVHQDDTQYTTVYDLNKGIIYLYHFHNYKKVITFNLKEELKKGKRVFVIPELFPEDKTEAYKGMCNLKTTIDSLSFVKPLEDNLIIARIKGDFNKRPYIGHVIGNYGYEFLHQKNTKDAIRIFNILVDLFPQSADAYDCLGEAYMEDRQLQLALKNYKHSIELDPTNVNGRQRINSLKKLIKN